jgi:AraC-like DNA-binding protein
VKESVPWVGIMQHSAVLARGEFFGTPGALLSGHGVHVSICHYASSARIGAHSHERPYFSFVLKGGYTECVGRREIDCAPLTARFHPAGEEHSNRFGPSGGALLNVELDADWLESVRELTASTHPPAVVDSAVFIGVTMADRCVAGVDNGLLAIEDLTTSLLDQFERRDKVDGTRHRHPGVRRAMDFIDAELCGRLSLTRIAAAAGLHPTHFARIFRRYTGLTVYEYVRHRRLIRAEHDLTNSEGQSLSMVAAENGFADHAHFTRTFKSMTGETPSSYRARVRRLRSAAALI